MPNIEVIDVLRDPTDENVRVYTDMGMIFDFIKAAAGRHTRLVEIDGVESIVIWRGDANPSDSELVQAAWAAFGSGSVLMI